MGTRSRSAKRSDSAMPSQPTTAHEPVKFELPIDFDEILALAVFDVVARGKRRKFRRRSRRARPL